MPTNMVCALSRLVIEPGDRVLFVPLICHGYQHWHNHYFIGDGPEEGPFAMFNIMGLPIGGVYQEDGSLTDIVDNVHTKTLSSYFGFDNIIKFIDFLVGKSPPWQFFSPMEIQSQVLDRAGGCYIHREVYDAVAKSMVNVDGDVRGSSALYHPVALSWYALRQLGFEEAARAGGEIQATHWEASGGVVVTLASDPDYYFYVGENRSKKVINLAELGEAIEEDFGFSLALSRFARMDVFEFAYDYLRDYLLGLKSSHDAVQKKHDKYFWIEHQGRPPTELFKVGNLLTRWDTTNSWDWYPSRWFESGKSPGYHEECPPHCAFNCLRDIYWEKNILYHEDVREALLMTARLNRLMWAAWAPYMPQLASPGKHPVNRPLQYDILDAAIDVLNKKMNE